MVVPAGFTKSFDTVPIGCFRDSCLTGVRCGYADPPGDYETAEERMATERTGGSVGGIGVGGILVIVGILLAIFWNVWVGVIVALVGLIAFGGFARGRWY
jgi:hypothetical protein